MSGISDEKIGQCNKKLLNLVTGQSTICIEIRSNIDISLSICYVLVMSDFHCNFFNMLKFS